MGYPALKDFDKLFIERTLENLPYAVKNEYTHLVNSLTGLIILPRQWIIQEKRLPTSFKKKLSDFPFFAFLNDVDTYIDDSKKQYTCSKLVLDGKANPLNELTLKEFLDKLRHSIAHQSLRPTREEDDWAGIVFRNYKSKTIHQSELDAAAWKNNYKFQLYLKMPEVKKTVQFIAQEYLK